MSYTRAPVKLTRLATAAKFFLGWRSASRADRAQANGGLREKNEHHPDGLRDPSVSLTVRAMDYASGNLDFSASLDKRGTDAFTDALHEDFANQAFQFPLEKICEGGGWADREDAVEFDITKVEERADTLVITAEVWFTECAPGGCPDLPNREARHGTVTVEIDKSTGKGDATSERGERRNLENY